MEVVHVDSEVQLSDIAIDLLTEDRSVEVSVTEPHATESLSLPVVEGELELTFGLPVAAIPSTPDRTIYVLNTYFKSMDQVELVQDFIREQAVVAHDRSLLDMLDHYGKPRLRMTFDPETSEKKFYVQAKLDLPSMPCSASEELGIVISEAQYFSFLEMIPHDSDDAVVSAYFKREIFNGQLDDGVAIKAEVDTIIGYGNFYSEGDEQHMLHPADAPVAKIDIEVPYERGQSYETTAHRIDLLRNGFHDLSFLDLATELTAGTAESEELRLGLRKKQLAESGFDAEESVAAVQVISSNYEFERAHLGDAQVAV